MSLVFGCSVAAAQTYSLDTGCTMDTSIEKRGGSLGNRVKDCTNGGAIATNDDGTNFPFFEKETSATINRVSSDKVVISARARAASTFESRPDPLITVNSHVQIGVRVHAFPVNQSYLVQVDGTVLAEWNRAGSSGLGSAGAGISFVNCPGKVITVGTGSAQSGRQTKTESVRCVIGTGNPGGLLTEVGASVAAQAVAVDGTANEHSTQMDYTVLVKRAGAEMRPLTGAQEAVAGSPLPQAVQVVVVQNDTDAPLPGHSVEFRLKDASGGILDTLTRTTLADGKAEANFTIPAGGAFSVEAVCAACVSGQTAVFPITALSGELAALPGPREGPVGGSVELTFKATEKVLVGGVVQESPIAGTPVGFAVTGSAGDAALSPNPATTGPDGVARVQFTLGSAPGTYTVTATCAACKAIPTAQVNISATQSAISLVKDTDNGPMAGDGQKAFIGDFLPRPFRVKLQAGGADRAQAGVTVRFVVEPPPGARGFRASPGTVGTDGQGKASTIITLGAQPGEYVVRAVCDDCTASREVVFAATAKPVPIFVARPPGDFWDGPSVTINKKVHSKAILGGGGVVMTVELSATGDPPGLPIEWRIIEGGEMAVLENANSNPVTIRPVAPSESIDDVKVQVRYGSGLFRTRDFHKITVQTPTSETFAKVRTQSCAPDQKNPPVKDRGTGRNGNLVEFQYTVFDQFGSTLAVPANKQGQIRAVEEGHVAFVTHDFPPWRKGLGVFEDPPLRETGQFVDVIGSCTKDPYPPGFLAIADRCQFVAGKRLGREAASYRGHNATITTSDVPGCPTPAP